MKHTNKRINYVVNNPFKFLRAVFINFSANQGLMLSGALAYYALLSIVPMLALILIALSQLTDVQPLLAATRETLDLIAPGQAVDLVTQISALLHNWKVVGVVGLLFLLFFSSLAFKMLESAMSVIFFHRIIIRRRHFLVSFIIPYGYIFFIALGLFLISTVSGTLHSFSDSSFTLLGYTWSLAGYSAGIIYLLGLMAEVLLLTSLYLVMPLGRLALPYALIGGITATLLWELTRHFLVWYFSTLSFVNIIYGTFATAIIILLTLEAAALIVLLGAQVISEYERIESGA